MEIPIARVRGTVTPAMDALTHGASRSWLDRAASGSAGAAAWVAGPADAPLGLVVVRMDRGELVLVHVRPDVRRRGVGMALLAAAERGMAASGAAAVRARWSTELRTAAAFEGLLARAGWSSPQSAMLLLKLGARMTEAPWFAGARIDPPWSAGPWGGIGAEERAVLEARRRWIPEPFWPFLDEDRVEPACSLGLRRDGELCGWVVAHRMGPMVVRYSVAYVEEPAARRRPVLFTGLVAEAFRLQLAALGAGSVGTLAVRQGNVPMVRWARRRLVPFADGVHVQRVAEKRLSGPDAAPDAHSR